MRAASSLARTKTRGRPVTVRYAWTKIDQDHARWEQAFSYDGSSCGKPTGPRTSCAPMPPRSATTGSRSAEPPAASPEASRAARALLRQRQRRGLARWVSCCSSGRSAARHHGKSGWPRAGSTGSPSRGMRRLAPRFGPSSSNVSAGWSQCVHRQAERAPVHRQERASAEQLVAPRARSPARGGCRPTPGERRRPPASPGRTGPSRSRIDAYSVVRPVSPLKNTVCRGDRIAIDDHSVALRSCSPRPEKCCEGAAVIVTSAVGQRCDSHQSSSVIRSAGTPQYSRCAPTPSERDERHRRASRARGSSGSRGGRSGRARRSPASSGGSDRRALERAGSAWVQPGGRGEARCPQTGSVRIRFPSISIRTVECPSQVARSPLPGFFVQRSRVHHRGQRRCRNTALTAMQEFEIEGILAAGGSRRPGLMGWTLQKPFSGPLLRGPHPLGAGGHLPASPVISRPGRYWPHSARRHLETALQVSRRAGVNQRAKVSQPSVPERTKAQRLGGDQCQPAPEVWPGEGAAGSRSPRPPAGRGRGR